MANEGSQHPGHTFSLRTAQGSLIGQKTRATLCRHQARTESPTRKVHSEQGRKIECQKPSAWIQKTKKEAQSKGARLQSTTESCCQRHHVASSPSQTTYPPQASSALSQDLPRAAITLAA